MGVDLLPKRFFYDSFESLWISHPALVVRCRALGDSAKRNTRCRWIRLRQVARLAFVVACVRFPVRSVALSIA